MASRSHLFAHFFRLRHINRWSLMYNFQKESIAEHTLNVCYIVHALCSIANDIYGKNIATEKVIVAAMMHSFTELFKGDFPTPLKLRNEDILTQFRYFEELASKRIMGMVPNELKQSYEPYLLNKDPEIKRWIKAADLCDSFIKCKVEIAAGNKEFTTSEKQVRILLYQLNMPEVNYFLEVFMPAFDMTLNEISITNVRLTKDMLPPFPRGQYEKKVVSMLHLLVEKGYFSLSNEDHADLDVIDGVQIFLNERGIRHAVFKRKNDLHVHLT